MSAAMQSILIISVRLEVILVFMAILQWLITLNGRCSAGILLLIYPMNKTLKNDYAAVMNTVKKLAAK
jgi:hypothetical protein